MAAGKRRFRALGLGDIFDETFDLYKSSFVLLASIAAVLQLPVTLGLSLAQTSLQPATMGPTPGPPDLTPFIRYFVVLGGFLALYVFISPIVTGAFTYAVSKRYLDELVTMRQSYGFILRRFGVVFLTLVLSWLAANSPFLAMSVVAGFGFAAAGPTAGMAIMFLLLLPAIVGAVYLGIRLLFVPAAVIVESRRYTDALARSWQLTSGYFWRLFGITVLIGIIVQVAAGMVTAPLQLAATLTAKPGAVSPLMSASAVVSALISSAIAPVMFIVVVLLYYDLRIRKEGFDLQMLARDLAAASGQAVPEVAYSEPAPAAGTDLSVCSYCRFVIPSHAEARTCPFCHRVFHASCWDEKGGCRTPGCPANPSGASQQAP